MGTPVLLSGCSGGSQEVSYDLAHSYLRGMGSAYRFERVADWRSLGHPPARIREALTDRHQQYLLIAAGRDWAELAVRMTTAPGAEPFNDNHIATGHACVRLDRSAPDAVATAIIDCPVHLGDDPLTDLPGETGSWGRDWLAEGLAHDADSGVRDELERLWTAGDGPASTPATRGQVIGAIRAAQTGTVPADLPPGTRQPAGVGPRPPDRHGNRS